MINIGQLLDECPRSADDSCQLSGANTFVVCVPAMMSVRLFSEKLQTLSTEGIFLTALGSSVLSEIGLLKAKRANKNYFYEM